MKVAFIAVLETLVTARIADNITGKLNLHFFNLNKFMYIETRFDQSKEIIGMSIGNIFSGFFGGLPCSGVLVRTFINIENGATHRTCQLISAIVVLILVLGAMPALGYIPMSVIAAILVTSSCRLIPTEIIS